MTALDADPDRIVPCPHDCGWEGRLGDFHEHRAECPVRDALRAQSAEARIAKAERERIATAIETAEIEVDLSVIAVPDGLDPEVARMAAITYFHSIAMVVREQAARIARAEPGTS